MQTWDEPFEGDCDVDLDSEFIVGVAWSERFGLGFDLVEGIAHCGVIGLAQLGELGFSGVAAEEQNIKAVFQQFDLVANGRAGYAQFTSGHAKRTKAGGGFKCG